MAGQRSEKVCAPNRSGPLIFLAVAVVMLLLSAYVLSVGPVCWLVDNGYIDGNSQLLQAIYAPLALLAMYCSPAAWALEAYMELFR